MPSKIGSADQLSHAEAFAVLQNRAGNRHCNRRTQQCPVIDWRPSMVRIHDFSNDFSEQATHQYCYCYQRRNKAPLEPSGKSMFARAAGPNPNHRQRHKHRRDETVKSAGGSAGGHDRHDHGQPEQVADGEADGA